jgi:putative nucleotidyltransferase with HDIG domain
MTEEEKELAYFVHDVEDVLRHGMCVSHLAAHVAREAGIDEEMVHTISVAGILHDIGKLRISPYIYGRQEDTMKIEEMRYMRLHAKMGSDIVRQEGYGDEIGDIILYHHENYDGSGYPYRLRGEEIPIGARVIRVCDVFIALISDRPYRKAFDPETALTMVMDEVRHFDMKLFLAFQRLLNTSDIIKELQCILTKDISGMEELDEYIELHYSIAKEEAAIKFDYDLGGQS